MASVDSVDDVVLNFLGHLVRGCLYSCSEELYAALDASIFVFESLFPFGNKLLQSLHVLLGQREHGLTLERNGVAHVAAVPCSKACLTLGYGVANEAHHELVGVGATLVNLKTGVATTQTLKRNLYG